MPKKITIEQLKELNFVIGKHFILTDDNNYEFDIHSNELLYINDGLGEPESVVIVDNFEHLKQVMESLGYE